MADINDTLQNTLQNETFDESLRKDAINSALGKDSVAIVKPEIEPAVDLQQQQANVGQSGPRGRVRLPKPQLSDEETAAQEQGATEAASGVVHSNEEDITALRKRQRATVEDGTSSQYIGQPKMDWSIENTTSKTDLDVNALYKQNLSYTAYEDLKYRCGLSKDASYTDYYNRTHYVPKGYEKEAKLLLAEEKRMKLYAQCEAGELSRVDFLYQAYGKDLLKEAGYDFSSPLFWYNRYKNGQFDNPLDSTSILSSIIQNAQTLWEAEEWYKNATEKKLSTSLAGIVTGVKLSDEKVYSLFENQFKAISDAVDMDTRDVIIQYQAGNLNGVFNPFIDIDGDGKYDYYYHLNGKLYAVQGSSGTGNDTCEIKYDYDDKGDIKGVKSVEIKEGLEGAVGGFIEGLGNFFGTLLDLVMMVDNAAGISAVVNAAQGDDYFVEGYQQYNAWKSRVFSNKDVVTFDGNHEWGYEIAQGIGTVTGQIILQVALALLTYGAGNAGAAAGETAVAVTAKEIAAQVGSAAAKAAIGAGIGAVVGAGAGAAIEGLTLEDGETFDFGSLMSGAVIGAGVGAGIGLSTGLTATTVNGSESAFAKASANIANREFMKSANFLRKFMANTAKLLQFVTKGNRCYMFVSSFKIGSRIGNAAILAIKDLGQTQYNLHVTNKILEYQAKQNPDAGIKPLTNGQIWGRALAVAGVDILISSTLRLQNENGADSMAKNLRAMHDGVTITNLLEEQAKAIGVTATNGVATLTAEAYRALPDTIKQLVVNMNSSIGASTFANIADVVENLLTMGFSAAMNNPYAKVGSAESLKTFASSMIAPQSVIQNLYITARNFGYMPGSESTYQARQASLLFRGIPAMNQRIDSFFAQALKSVKSQQDADALRQLYMVVQQIRTSGKTPQETISNRLQATVNDKGQASFSGSFYENSLKAAAYLNQIFDEEAVANMDVDVKKALIDALGIKTDTELKQKLAQVSQAETEQGVQLASLFATSVFDEVSAENRRFLLATMQSNLNTLASFAESEHKLWFDFFTTGKKKFERAKEYLAAYDKSVASANSDKALHLMHSEFTEFLAQASKASRDEEFRNFAATFSMQSVFNDMSAKFGVEAFNDNIVEEIFGNKQFAKFGVASDFSVFQNKSFRIEEQPDKSIKIVWLSKNKQPIDIEADKEISLFKLLTNKQFVDDMVKFGILKKNRNGSYKFLEDKPLFFFYLNNEKINDFNKSENQAYRNLWYAFQKLASMCNEADPEGKKIINTATPLLRNYMVQSSNSSNSQSSDVEVFVIPTTPEMTNFNAVSALQSVTSLAKTLYHLQKSSPVQADIDTCLVDLGKASLFGWADGWRDLDEFKDMSIEEHDELKLRGIASLLHTATLDSAEDDKIFGINRAVILRLCTLNGGVGAISRADLKTLKEAYELGKGKNIISEAAYNNIIKLDSYLQKIEEITPVLNILAAYSKAVQTNTTMNITNSDAEKVRTFLADLTKTENEWLKDALIADGNINNNLIVEMINHPELRLPFSNGLGDLSRPLTHLKTSKGFYSNAIQKAVQDKFDALLEAYNTYSREQVTKLAQTPVQLLRKYIKTNISEYSKYKKKDSFAKEIIGNYKELLKLDDSQLINILNNPVDEIQKIFDEKIKLAYSTKIDSDEYNMLVAARTQIQTDLGDAEKLMLTLFGTIDGVELDQVKDIQSFYDAITSDEQSVLKDYINYSIKILEHEKSGDLRQNTFELSKDNKILYNGKELLPYLQSRLEDIKYLIRNPYLNVNEIIQNERQIHHKYLYNNTKVVDNPNVLEINFIDLIPNNYKKFLSLVIQSEDFYANESAKAAYEDVIKEINKITARDGYGNYLDSQMATYMEMIDKCIEKGSFTVRIPLSDTNRINAVKKHLALIGYTQEDIINAEQRNSIIPGMLYKNVSMRGIETKLNYNDLCKALASQVKAEFLAQGKEPIKDYTNILENMFRSSNMFTDNSKLNLYDEDGKLVKLFGLFNDLQSEPIYNSLADEIFANLTKTGLSAGAGAKTHTQINKAIGFNALDGISKDSLQVYNIVQAFKEFFLDSKKSDSPTTLRFDLPNNKASQDLVKNISAMIPKDAIYSLTTDSKKSTIKLYFTYDIAKINSIDSLLKTDSFDMLKVLPIFFGERFTPVSGKLDGYTFIKSSNQSMLEYLIAREQATGMTSYADIVDICQKPVSIYTFDESEYEDFVKGCTTIKDFKDKYETTQNKSNYYIQSLMNYIRTGEIINSINSNNLIDKSLYVFNDKALRRIVSTVLKDFLVTSSLEDLDTNKLITEVIRQYQQETIRSSKRLDKYVSESIYYNPKVTSGSISKLNVDNDMLPGKDIRAGIETLIDKFRFDKDFIFDTTNTATMLKHNPVATFLSLLDTDTEGNVFIPLDYLSTLSVDDLNNLPKLISSLIDNINSSTIYEEYSDEAKATLIKSLNNLSSQLEEKVDNLKDLVSIKDDTPKSTLIIHEPKPGAANAPSIRIGSFVLYPENLNDPELLEVLIQNQSNTIAAKKPYQKYITTSTFATKLDEDNNFSPLIKMYNDLLNNTLIRTVDKAGHTYVYNMESAEARAAFVDTIMNFSQLLLDNNIGNLQDLPEDVQAKIFTEIALACNLYSTGVSIASEYSGALLIEIPEDGNSFDAAANIKPIVLSSTNKEKDLLGNLLLGDKSIVDIAKDTKHKHILITMDKNAFSSSLSGYDSKIKIFDLDSEDTRQMFIAKAIMDAEQDNSIKGTIAKPRQKILLDYYTRFPTVYEYTQHLVKLAIASGIPQNIANNLFPTIKNLDVAQPTKFGQEQINVIASQFITPLTVQATNRQVQAAKDIFIHGVCYDSLSNNIKDNINNMRQELLNRMSDTSIEIADNWAKEGWSEVEAKFTRLSEQEQIDAIQLYMLNRKNGSDLEYILSNKTVTEHRQRIAEQITKENNNAYINRYNESTGKFELVNWRDSAIDGKPTKHKTITPYNILEKGNAIIYDSEWLGGEGITKNAYQIAFALIEQNKVLGNISSDSLEKHNILIAENLDAQAVQGTDFSRKGLYHVEDESSYKTKLDLIKNHKIGETFVQDGITYHIVNSAEEAHKILQDFITAKKVLTIMGFNNKSVDSDDAKMRQTDNGKALFKNVHNLDIRLDLANNSLSDNNQREAYRRDAMDFIKENLPEGTFTDFGKGTAHDAVYDIINEFELYKYLVTHRLDIKNIYDEGYQEFKQNNISDDLLNKALNFHFTGDGLDLDDANFIASLNTIKKSNPILKNLLDAYNSGNAIREATVKRKEFARTTREILLGSLTNPSQTRVDWYNSVKDYAHRTSMQIMMYNLMQKTAIADDVRKQYLGAHTFIHEGIKLFKENSDIVKQKIKELGYDTIGNELLYQLFYSQDIDTQADYIAQANKFKKEDLLQDSDLRKQFFENKSNIDIIASPETESLDYRTENSAAYNNVVNHFINQVVQPLYNMFKDTGLLDSCYDFTTTVFNNLLRVYGDYNGSFKQAMDNRKTNITRFTTNLNKELFDFIKHNLSLEDGGLFASSKALYGMASERAEFNDTLNRDLGEFGCVYIGDKLLHKAFPTLDESLIKEDSNGRKYFYTQVWRQPGQGKTSHILKVYIESGNSMQMTRATSQTYFNGDFDGDSYFFGKPDKVMQEYGEAMFDMSRAGSSLFDLFTNTTIKYDDNKIVDTTAANVTKEYLASFMSIYKDYSEGHIQKAINKISALENLFKSKFQDPEEFKIMWSIYGIHPHNDKEGNQHLFCKNFALYKIFRDSNSAEQNHYADLMDEAGRIDIFQNQYTSDFDSQLVGNISKFLKNETDITTTKDISQILYANDINLNAASLLHLNNILQAQQSQDDIKNKLIEGIKNISYLSKQQKDNITKEIKNFSQDITALDILSMAQLIQRYVTSSSKYTTTFKQQLEKNLSAYTKEYKDKYSMLYDYCKNQLPDFTMPTDAMDPTSNLSGPEIMHNTALLMQSLQKYSNELFPYISSYKNNTMRRLMSSVLTQGNLDVKSSRTATVVGANGTVSINNVEDSNGKLDYTKVGLTKMKVMVLKKGDTSLTDGILSTKYNKTRVMNLDKVSLNSLPQDIVDTLSKKTKITGQELSDLLYKSKLKHISLIPEKKYKIYITKDALVVRDDMTYTDLVKQGYVKQGRATTKAGKGTVSYFDGTITTEDKSLLPDIIMSADLFDLENEKGSAQTGNKHLGKCTYEGNEYDVYEVEDIALLNSWNQNSLSVGEKAEDRISILQGQKAIDAFITMGGATTIELSKDGIKFNPEGLNEYLSVMDSFNKPIASETNGAKEIRALQIAALLSSMDSDLQSKVLSQLGYDTTLNEALSDMYKIRSLGKDGADIIEVIKNIVWKQPKSKRDEIITKLRNNPVFNKLFGTRINNSMSSSQQTSQDLSNEEWFRSRWDVGQTNPAETTMHKVNTVGARYAAAIGSGEDLNGNNFYSRVQLIEDLLESHLSKDMLTKAAEIGLFDLEELVPPSQLNGFRSTMKSQANIFGRKQELTPQFKHGGQESPYTGFVNDEAASAYINTISKLERDDMTAHTKGLNIFLQNIREDGSYQNKAGYMEHAHKYFTPFMSNGQDDSMINLMYNQTYRMSGMLDTPYLRANNTQTSLELGTYHRTQSLTDPESYHNWLNDQLKNSYAMQQKSNKMMSNEAMLKNSANLIDEVTNIKDFLQTEEIYVDASLKKLFDRFKGDDEFTNVSNFHDMEYYLQNQLNEEDYINACKLWNNNNGTDVTSSFFSSSGIKSKGNIALDLDNRVIYLNTQVDTKLRNILGKEFDFLVKIGKDKPSLLMALNKYMDIKYKLDVYDTLISTEKKQIKNYGKDSYNQMVLDAKKLISSDITKFDTEYKALTIQLKEIESNEFISGMLNAVTNLNLRLTELAQSYNPLSLIGYYLPQYSDSLNDKIFTIATRVDAYKMANDYTREILNGYKKNPDGSYSFATAIYNSKDGYLGMINKVAQQYAVTETMKELGTFLKTQGYMRNLDIYSQAHTIFANELSTAFIASFENLDASTKLSELNADTYNILKAKTNELLVNKQQSISDYVGAQSFIELYETLSTLYEEALSNAGCQSASDLEIKYRESLSVATELRSNSDALAEAIKVKELYECTLASMLGILEDNGSKSSMDFLTSLYTDIAKLAAQQGCKLVDNRGAILDPTKPRPTTSTLDIDDIVQECKLMFAGSKEAEIAKMALLGDVYMMKESVADQLDDKVFTKTVPGTVGKALSKAKSYVTSFIMASPISLIDRKINFTMFDVGTLMSADAKALRYLMPCIATIERYAMNPDAVTEVSITTDKYLQLLLRYMAASGQTPLNATNIYGEEVRAVNVPVVKQIMLAVQKELAKQQFYARFAYFCDLVVDGEINDFNLNPKQFGVAFHLQDGLKRIQANNKDNFVYKNIYDFKNNKFYSYDTDADYLQRMMNMDAAALQVVAENVGVFGNMPHGSSTLSKLGMMFTGFPLAAARWGKNRIQSLGYALTHLGDKTSGAWGYLGRNLGSSLATYTLLLALQILLSNDTKEYLNKRIYERKSKDEAEDELGDLRMANVKNILFRGGCVRPFQSWLNKEEYTQAGHSRDALSYLWSSWVADFFLKEDDETVGDAFWNVIKTNLWNHVNPLIKDVAVESWFTPEDNYFENLGRKAAGYVLGTAQASTIIDSMKASKHEDQSFVSRLATGFRTAYGDSFSNTKEYKSSWKNYKKAFELVYDYTSQLTNNSYETSDSYSKLKKELNLALRMKSSPKAFYEIVEDALDSGTSLSEVKSAVQNCSLRYKLMKLDNIDGLKEFLTDSQMAVIKSALAYEDYMFPYLTNYIDDLQDMYNKENKKNNSYTTSIASKLRTYYYNTPAYNRAYNMNTKNYIRGINMISNANYTPSKINPMEAYEQARKNINYGVSTDIYGNKTQHYTNGTSYQQRNRGSSIIPGGNA